MTKRFDALLLNLRSKKLFVGYFGAGIFIGLILDTTLGLEAVTANPLLPTGFLVIVLVIGVFLTVFLRELSNESLGKAGLVFFGIVVISLLFAVQRFLNSVNFFATGAYETGWVIGGKPNVYYPPELIYAVVRSSFLAGMFAFLERYVNLLRKQK